MGDLHLYRVTVHKYPTQDGKPFADQSVEFWQKCLDAHYNPSLSEQLPAFMDWDFEGWIYQQDNSWYENSLTPPSEGAGKHVQTDPPMIVPFQHRKHWMNGHSARLMADRLREWGCIVTVEKSKPIEFEETDD